MNVLYISFQNEISLFDFSEYCVESFCKGLKFFLGQQAYRLQHSDVCLRSQHIIPGKSQVKDSVVSYSECINKLCCLCSFTPKCTHIIILPILSFQLLF